MLTNDNSIYNKQQQYKKDIFRGRFHGVYPNRVRHLFNVSHPLSQKLPVLDEHLLNGQQSLVAYSWVLMRHSSHDHLLASQLFKGGTCAGIESYKLSQIVTCDGLNLRIRAQVERTNEKFQQLVVILADVDGILPPETFLTVYWTPLQASRFHLNR